MMYGAEHGSNAVKLSITFADTRSDVHVYLKLREVFTEQEGLSVNVLALY
jgi:hypothetical protein